MIQVRRYRLQHPHNFIICGDFDGTDVWVGTSKGLGHGIGTGYYPGLKPPADREHRRMPTTRALRSKPPQNQS
jgi:hypothetical protein